MYSSITITKEVSRGTKKVIASPPKDLKNSNFFLKNAILSYQRRGLRPEPLYFDVNTCNLAKLGKKRTIFKHLFDFAENFDSFQVFVSSEILNFG